MSLRIFDRQLQLLALLTDNRTRNVNQVAREMGMSRRQIYRYLGEFQNAGFLFDQHGSIYRLLPSSPFFRRLTDGTYLSREEAQTLHQLVCAVSHPSPPLRHLRDKLQRLSEDEPLAAQFLDERAQHNLMQILQAIRTHRCVLLRGYASQHSTRTDDRLVEPFALMNGNADVRCYEPESQANKTFRLTRMDDVQLLPQEWQYAHLHSECFTDFFGYSSETPQPVHLSMTRRAWQTLCEEYPAAGRQEWHTEAGRYTLSTLYSHPDGIGRFILSLLGEVQASGAPEIQHYIEQRIQAYRQTAHQPSQTTV